MKKIIIALLAVLICCSAVFAASGTTVSLAATFGFDEVKKFTFDTASVAVSGAAEKIKYSFGYNYVANEDILDSVWNNGSNTGLFATIILRPSKVITITETLGYRLFPVYSSSTGNYQNIENVEPSYTDCIDTITYIDKGFYANTNIAVSNVVKGLTLTTGVSTDIKNNELNLTGGTFTANYENTFEDTHYVDLVAGANIFTDKDSDGKLYKTSSQIRGKATYSYKSRYLFSSTGIYFKSYTDKAVEDGLYTQSSFAWRVNEEDFCKEIKWIDNLKLRVAVSTWAPKENGELKLAKVTTNEGLDYSFVNGRLNGSFDSYYNHFVDNEEDNYFYTENKIYAAPLKTKDWEWDVNYTNSILVNKVADKLNVIEAQHTLDNDIKYKNFEWTLNVDYKHSQDNDPEKNRILTNFEAWYSFAKSLLGDYLQSARIHAGVNGKYYKLNEGFSKGEYDGYAGSEIKF